MDEVQSGAVAPDANVTTPPAADAVPAPGAPAVQENAEGQKTDEPVPQPKTYTEEETRKLVNERLTKERRRLERQVRAEVERDYLKQQLEARDKPQAAQQPPGRPKESDFAGRPYSDYIDALTDWKLEQRLTKEREASKEQTAQQREARRAEQEAQIVHDKIIRAGQQKYPDFVDVVMGDDVEGITQAMVVAATKLPNGPDVLYHLGQNEAERLRIAGLSDVEQVWELKELSSKLSAPPKTTTAPPPIVPNSTRARTETGYRPDMSDKEFAEWRKRQIAQRR